VTDSDSSTTENARTSHYSSHYNTARHRALIAELVAEGWQTQRWKDAVIRRVSMGPWCAEDGYDLAEVRDLLAVTGITPDAYRLTIMRQHDYPPLLVLDLAEVIVTHGITKDKMGRYLNLWWGFDATDRLHLRVWTVDAYGRRGHLLDGSPLHVEKAVFPEWFRADPSAASMESA
jgi:hypothetical protein